VTGHKVVSAEVGSEKQGIRWHRYNWYQIN